METQEPNTTEFWGEPISTYSRSQAIEDGYLIDVSETAREAGIKFPVALTIAAHGQVVRWDETERKRWAKSRGAASAQDEAGRLWDVLNLFAFAARAGRGKSEIRYTLSCIDKDTGRRTTETLKAVCGPGDDPRPVITIMLPEED